VSLKDARVSFKDASYMIKIILADDNSRYIRLRFDELQKSEYVQWRNNIRQASNNMLTLTLMTSSH